MGRGRASGRERTSELSCGWRMVSGGRIALWGGDELGWKKSRVDFRMRRGDTWVAVLVSFVAFIPLSNWLRGFDRYSMSYSKAHIPESRFPNAFYMLQ